MPSLEATLDPAVLRTLAGLGGLLVVASAIVLLHPQLRGEGGRSVREAVLSWWPVSVVGGVALAVGPWAAVPIFVAVTLACR